MLAPKRLLALALLLAVAFAKDDDKDNEDEAKEAAKDAAQFVGPGTLTCEGEGGCKKIDDGDCKGGDKEKCDISKSEGAGTTALPCACNKAYECADECVFVASSGPSAVAGAAGFAFSAVAAAAAANMLA